MSGIIDISKLNTPPKKHELETARYFADRGHDIIFLTPSNIPDFHTPDILMDGIEWEMKAPQGRGKRTIEKTLLTALAQSCYIIIGLRRINLSESQCISKLEYNFEHKKRLKRLLVIKKNGQLLTYSR